MRVVRPIVMGPVHRVTAVVGEDILLPCHLVPNNRAENMTVEWIQHSTGRLVHLYKGGRNVNDRQDPAYRDRTALSKVALDTGNASLQLANVHMADDGDYTCLIGDGPWKHQLTMHVEVNGMPNR